jgi:hypothetical protein
VGLSSTSRTAERFAGNEAAQELAEVRFARREGMTMDYISLVLSILFSVGATIGLALSIFFFFHDKHKRGISFSTLMFVCALLAYVPQLDSIKSGFVDAKFNRTINQANDTIARLTKMAIINARVSYATLAWGGRLGGPYARDKQLILDDVDRQLFDLRVDQNDRKQISQTLVQLIAFDLYNVFTQSMDRLIQAKAQQTNTSNSTERSAASEAAWQTFVLNMDEWRKQAQSDIPIEKFAIRDQFQRAIPAKLLSDSERKAANGFVTELLLLFDGCEKKGGYTDQAAAFLDTHRELAEINQKTKEVYGYTFE